MNKNERINIKVNRCSYTLDESTRKVVARLEKQVLGGAKTLEPGVHF